MQCDLALHYPKNKSMVMNRARSDCTYVKAGLALCSPKIKSMDINPRIMINPTSHNGMLELHTMKAFANYRSKSSPYERNLTLTVVKPL